MVISGFCSFLYSCSVSAKVVEMDAISCEKRHWPAGARVDGQWFAQNNLVHVRPEWVPSFAFSAHIASFSGLQYMSLKLITSSTSGRMTLPSSFLLLSMQKAFKFRKLICSAQPIPGAKPERAVQSQGETGKWPGRLCWEWEHFLLHTGGFLQEQQHKCLMAVIGNKTLLL